MSADKSTKKLFTFDPMTADPVRSAIVQATLYATTESLKPQCAARLVIIIEELFANICEHGSPDGVKPISLSLEVIENHVLMELHDYGISFDPRQTTAFTGPDAFGAGGAGLALVRGWAEIIDYQSRHGENRLQLKLPLA